MGGHIFVSYSRSDHWYVSQLADYLADVGITVSRDAGRDTDERFEVREEITTSAAVVVVSTPRSVRSDSVQEEIRYAMAVPKPVLALLLEPCPCQDMPMPIAYLHHDDVVGGRMPSAAVVERLRGLAGGLTTAGPADADPRDPATAELIARYTPQVPARVAPAVAPDPESEVTEIAGPLPEPDPAPRARVRALLPAVAGMVAAVGLVWMLANRLPRTADGSPDPPATAPGTLAVSAAAAVNAFISAAEVRDDDGVRDHVCERYKGVQWYASDFYAPNFIQAKLVLVRPGRDATTANLELSFQVDGSTSVKGVQYSVVTEGRGWKVCGPA